MKNTYYYLLAFVALAFTACQKEPALHSASPSEKKDLTITLQPSDYKLVTGYPSSALTIDDDADAQKYIPEILNSEYANLDNGSTAAVTYAKSALYFKLADSVLSDVAYTLTNSDYTLLPGNSFTDFSLAQALAWLPYKFTSPKNNQLELVNFTVYPPTTVPPPPYSYLYTNGKWQQIYTVQPAQYTEVGLGKYDQFEAANNPNLPATFNAFLRADINVMDTIKTGDIEYVSFGYFDSNDYQRVLPLEYDGSNFVSPQVSTGTVNFIKQNGTWVFVKPLPVVAYTLNSADLSLIAASSFGTASQRTDVGQYGDFSGWSTTDLNSALILVLTTDFKTPAINTNYEVTFLNYTGGSDVPTIYTFQWDGTTWQPQQK